MYYFPYHFPNNLGLIKFYCAYEPKQAPKRLDIALHLASLIPIFNPINYNKPKNPDSCHVLLKYESKSKAQETWTLLYII